MLHWTCTFVFLAITGAGKQMGEKLVSKKILAASKDSHAAKVAATLFEVANPITRAGKQMGEKQVSKKYLQQAKTHMLQKLLQHCLKLQIPRLLSS